MIAQNLCQAHYQILSIIFLKEFIKLNVNSFNLIENVKHVEFNIRIATVFRFFEYMNFESDLIEFKCLCCNKNYQHKFDEKLKKQFFITRKFFNRDSNRFILLLQKRCLSL